MDASLSRSDLQAVYDLPLLELVNRAATVHRAHHDPAKVQCAALLSIKTGGCPEDCAYCPQSARYATDTEATKLMDADEVISAARNAKAAGADRFCLGAAWRSARTDAQFDRVLEMIREVKALGLETCATLGMLTDAQAESLQNAGLDYYNHNLDTSPEFYGRIISTRTYEDRLNTLERVRSAGMAVCCGGIVGLGESPADHVSFLYALASQTPQPESVPINSLVAVEGTPLAKQEPVAWDTLVRVVAAARVAMPRTMIRLSAGRASMSEAEQALCFLSGANSIFLGDTLLTTPNAKPGADAVLFEKLGLQPLSSNAQ